MGQAIYYHEYTLRSRTALNALSDRREHRGLLIRIGDGVGCVHPWPELGDAPVETQLEALRAAEPTALIARAYRCAGLDGLARREGRSLFEGLAIPESHAPVSDVEGALAAVEEGFELVKMKGGGDLAGDRERLRSVAEAGISVRMDFNEIPGREAFREWWEGVGERERARVDFLEDPFAYSANEWSRVDGVRLAVDRAVGEATGGYAVAVVKPAKDEISAILEREQGCELVFTSYMDHPIGQMYAAYEAAVARRDLGGRVKTCGLLTHGLFEGDDFLEAVVSEGPKLVAPEGKGLGFDDLLERIAWKKLS